MGLTVSRLQFEQSERYPYVVRVSVTLSATLEHKDLEQFEMIDEWLQETGIDYKAVGMSFYLPSMAEAELIVLKFSNLKDYR